MAGSPGAQGEAFQKKPVKARLVSCCSTAAFREQAGIFRGILTASPLNHITICAKNMVMAYTLSDPMNSLARCPQCGIAHPNLQLCHVMYQTEHRPTSGSSEDGWVVYQCSSCRDPVLFFATVGYADDYASQRAYINRWNPSSSRMFPTKGIALDDWPERAAQYMRQAHDSLFAPDGAVMLAGSAVDAMLKDKGLSQGSVYKRIEEAVTANLLTPEMGEWAHAVRLAANSPRHADLDEPHATREEAEATLEFVNALGQFLYVLPERIRKGKAAASALN